MAANANTFAFFFFYLFICQHKHTCVCMHKVTRHDEVAAVHMTHHQFVLLYELCKRLFVFL